MTVVDLPPGLDLMNGKSLGLRIMNSLAAQLGGELTWIEQNKGTVVRLAFPRVSSIVSITDKPK
jgi:two-component sensor histidine kinase